ncbi:MAG: protein-L-isoaspartate(D-aspartate) O-methyltransferase [Pseudomonadales bacterium]
MSSHVGKSSPQDWVAMRDKMVAEVQYDMARVRDITGRDQLSPEVTQALGDVERHLFVPDGYRSFAYDNRPLPIGEGQTISQPFIVALMTELLNVDKRSRVLELGTGSGYQAAVLAEVVDEVYTIEIVVSLARVAADRLEKLGYTNIHVRQGDGTLGWPEAAPFDGIMVTAAGIDIPRPLLEQLASGGRLVMPVGARDQTQQLMVITRNEDGTFTEEPTIPVRFVPITGDNAGQ